MPRIVKLSLVLLALIVGLLFHLKNSQRIEIDYYVGIIELPLSAVLVLSVCAGVALGVLAGIPMLLKLKRENRRLLKRDQRRDLID